MISQYSVLLLLTKKYIQTVVYSVPKEYRVSSSRRSGAVMEDLDISEVDLKPELKARVGGGGLQSGSDRSRINKMVPSVWQKSRLLCLPLILPPSTLSHPAWEQFSGSACSGAWP